MTTILEIIDGGTRYLEKRGVDDARLNMQLMVAHRLGCNRMQLYLDFDKALAEDQLAPLREDLKRRGEGTPLQHITGVVEFCKREFLCDSRALIPRPETEELVSLVLGKIPENEPLRILDLCTGSGVIGLTLAAELPKTHVICSDISEDTLSLACENAEKLGVTNATFTQSDGFDRLEGHFDIIISNPPYVADSFRTSASREVTHDPDIALYSGADGLDFIRSLIPEAFSALAPGGLIALEIGHDQAQAVESLLTRHKFSEVFTHHDLNGIPRFPCAMKPGQV